MHRLDGDPKWSARAVQELMTVCAFPDWYPEHFLDVGEMAHGVGVGYDWFYDVLDEEQRATVRKSLIEKALQPGLSYIYAKPQGWHRPGTRVNNWNPVCNGGLIVAALAIADEEKKVTREVMNEAMPSLELAMNLYWPDGAWDEGPGYGNYATNYVISAAEALRTATGSDGGISRSPALELYGEFLQHSTGGTGQAFNFADGAPGRLDRSLLLWLGKTYNRPDISSLYKSSLLRVNSSSRLNRFASAHALLWFDCNSGTEEWRQAPLDRVFRRIEMASFRTAWDDNAFSVSIKGGDNRFNHGDLDLGTFVIDGLGVRWAMELGADNYGLPGYFNPDQRFTYYRTSSAGQNALTWDDGNQSLDGTGFVETFLSVPERGQAVLDLSKGYSEAKRVRRGVRLERGEFPSILLQDEIIDPGKGTLVWGMHTQAAVDIQGSAAILSLGGRKLKATILAPDTAVFEVKEVNLEPPAYPTPDTRKLMVRVPSDSGKPIRIAVRFALENDPAPAPKLESLDSWGGKVVPR